MYSRRVASGAVLVCTSLALVAQSPQANISGAVRDPQGAAVPNIEVVAANVATAVKTTTRTDAQGLYTLRALPIGAYTLSVEAPGFRRYLRQGLILTTGQNLELDIPLEVGAVNETITLSAAASTLETRTSDAGQLVESKAVEDIPLGDRRMRNIIGITGAAVFVNYDSGGKPNFSLAGGRTQSQ